MSEPIHQRDRIPNYDKRPVVAAGDRAECALGWDEVCDRLSGTRVVAVETYPGVLAEDLRELARRLAPDVVVDTAEALKPADEITRLVAGDLTDEPVFGRLTHLTLRDLFDPSALQALRDRVAAASGRVLVTGAGAAFVTDGMLVYAGMPRWEIQQRQRRGEAGSIGVDDAGGRPADLYKRGFFVDWRIADRHRRSLYDRIAAYLDTTERGRPKLLSARTLWRALRETAHRPFRVVPFFDPAPWGGHWIERVCDIDHDGPNIGWCFDCVPEENSLLLAFGDAVVEVPAIDLVFREPRLLLGEAVHGRFGEEFPIRFDFLDTIGGGNLSLQVHPQTSYIQEHFGIPYTQDESYYILDAGPDATVYLGLAEGIDRPKMLEDLRRADADPDFAFPADAYVNRFPAKRHDHFLIPAGTVHCSGAGAMVLEISATPYIFTFKLWDWGRLGLDGAPRPTHLHHGEASIRWERDATYAKTELINRLRILDHGDGWTEERTGLHPAEFIETRRHRFMAPVPHAATDGVNVLNLVEGEEAMVTSPDGAFDPFVVHYAETFIVPAGAGPYEIRPHGPGEGMRCATIKAFVRTRS